MVNSLGRQQCVPPEQRLDMPPTAIKYLVSLISGFLSYNAPYPIISPYGNWSFEKGYKNDDTLATVIAVINCPLSLTQ